MLSPSPPLPLPIPRGTQPTDLEEEGVADLHAVRDDGVRPPKAQNVPVLR